MPVLLACGLPPQVALGTNKMQSTFGTALAVAKYHQVGLVNLRSMALPLVVTFCAALVGTWVVTQVSNALLKQLVPWLLLAVAAYTLLSPRLGAEARAARLNPTAFAWLVGAVLGFYDGFFGPGTGSFWVLACVGLLGLDLPSATGYTKAVNLASNVASALVFAVAGAMRPDIGLVMIGGQLVGAWLGAHLAIRHGAGFIRVVFLLVVVGLIVRLLLNAG